MGVRSILDIEVNDSAFQRFSALYGKYEAALKASPSQWKKVTDQVGRTRSAFDDLVKQQISVQARSKLIAEAQKEAERRTRSWADGWRDVAQFSGQVARNVAAIGTSALRWTVFGGAATGLLGAGSLFGLDRLGGAVSANRRSSLGLGTSYGERSAFQANFGRLVDSDQFLEQIANARFDVSKRTSFYGAGLNDQDLAGSTGDVATKYLRQLKRIADETNPELYEKTIQARRLLTSSTDLNRLRNTSGAEFESLMGAYGENKSRFNLPPDTQQKWQEFTTALGRAAQGIENTFVKILAPLVEPLGKLSDRFERLVSAMLGSDTVKKWMDEVGKGFETLAKYVGTDDFQENVKKFADGVGNIATALFKFVQWFADSEAGKKSGFAWNKEQAGHDTWNDMVSGAKQLRSVAASAQDRELWSRPDQVEAYIREAAKKRGIDPDQAVRVAKSEGLDRYVGDKGTSFGPFQLHYKSDIRGLRSSGLGDEFTQHTGLDARDRSTIKQQIDFSLDRARESGWGPWHGWQGDPWAGISQRTKVTVDNNTGGSAVVSASQLPQ